MNNELVNLCMSSFTCEQCGTDCIDTPSGYITGCEHFPVENTGKRISRKVYSLLNSFKLDCEAIGHNDLFKSMGGGYIWWKCSRCSRTTKTEDVPFMSCASSNIAPVMARNRGIGDLGSAASTPTNTRPHDA